MCIPAPQTCNNYSDVFQQIYTCIYNLEKTKQRTKKKQHQKINQYHNNTNSLYTIYYIYLLNKFKIYNFNPQWRKSSNNKKNTNPKTTLEQIVLNPNCMVTMYCIRYIYNNTYIYCTTKYIQNKYTYKPIQLSLLYILIIHAYITNNFNVVQFLRNWPVIQYWKQYGNVLCLIVFDPGFGAVFCRFCRCRLSYILLRVFWNEMN